MTLVKYLLSLILVFCFVSDIVVGGGFDNNFWKYSWIKTRLPLAENSDEIANYILDSSNRLLDGNYKISTCVFKVESDFDNSKKGDGYRAVGLGQMHKKAMIDSCKYLGLKNCKYSYLVNRVKSNKKFAIELSIAYLSLLKRHYKGDVVRAVVAYNVGIDNVDKGYWNFKYLQKVTSCVLEEKKFVIDVN